MNDRADRLRQARIAAGFARPVEAAARHGWNVNTYKSNENGAAPFSFAKAKDYARAFAVRAEWLYDGGDTHAGPASRPVPLAMTKPGDPINIADVEAFIGRPTPPIAPGLRIKNISRKVPVVGDVAAGVWREAVPVTLNDVSEHLDIDVAGYERAQLRAMMVVGPSMDLFYPPGRYVVVAHPSEAGIRVGDHVIVERHRAGLVEITIKELTRDGDRIALWPRSSHEDYQAPIYLEDHGEHDQTAPMIVGVVVADYGKRDRPPAVFVQKGM